MKIIPLDKTHIGEAINLLNSVFPDDVARYNNPEISMRCGLDPENYSEYWNYFQLAYTYPHVLIDNKKIIGTTGLYHLKTDPEDRVWLGWFCIASEYRGKGLGKMLLQWTIDLARKKGYKTLRLYASNNPRLIIAQKLYDQFGFKKIGEDFMDGEDVIYKETTI